ncbi:di-trans,poly-cis-decaprenylcistransferase [Kangiella profundi]|uniref:Ditrans,polycis-undecaprenyl-diphosphate synthase ((2E,6E)-farnesyl-diphosphate specific) n=1 Tax=Kangiella profundi TaxID=1561924 RepID=A0A2K9AD44_9GAMM|nr:isoprenyl transferase [Kangiella profundi]AUD79357.1 di-trans,poly-cis-decaprenylcistransferase [Kangiella profundi]GGE99227.1 isoprenyl transferase [Kangiella profundi]
MSDKQKATTDKLPQHIAIIMDGNGRWAQARGKKRVFGHKAGMERAREMAEACGELGVKYLTLFAFSSENWNRPPEEVSFLMDLFATSLKNESKKLNKNNVQLKVIGDKDGFDKGLQKAIDKAEALTADNDGLVLNIAANYGGRWDILQAVQKLLNSGQEVTEENLSKLLATGDAPEPDLLIRTGGEKRISNFLLWQAAYSELYFSDALWPDFDSEHLKLALADYAQRQRRFGKTGEQVTG